MSHEPNETRRGSTDSSRRTFLKQTAATAAVLGPALSIGRSAHAAGNGTIKVGVVGCGGRGSGAAANAMNAGKDVQLVAMADVFQERVTISREQLKKLYPEQVQVADDHCFVGFDAYQKLIASGVDVVLIATTSHFHPVILKAAIDAGKHVFCEKPVGIDVPGIKMATAASEDAAKKGLSLVSGLCWRYDAAVQETVRRVHEGAIGDIVVLQEVYARGPYILRERQPGWTEMEFQFQDWYHFNWLSGDDHAQSLIHNISRASWLMNDAAPVKAWGMGGRQVCLEPKYGDVFDHQAVVYEYANGARLFGYCRDIPNCHNEVSGVAFGTKGRAVMPYTCRIEGEKPWRYKGKADNMYDREHQTLFGAIRSGKPVNDGKSMCVCAMMGILAQMACYSGQEVTWEQAMKSEKTFALPKYGWDVEPPVKPGPDGRYPTAMPGVTKPY